MSFRPRRGRRTPVSRAGGRFSLCLTRRARTGAHAVRRVPPRYGAIFTGATVIATILVALAVWPRESLALPEPQFEGSARPVLATRYGIDDFIARAR